MSAQSIAYTHSEQDTSKPDEPEAKIITVLEAGFINDSTINKFSYSFSNPSDITDSIEKSKKKNKIISTKPGRDGRVVYSGMSTKYPDGTISDTVVIEDIVFQYREKVAEDSTYGKQFICVGIKQNFIQKFISDAMNANPSVHIKPPAKVKLEEGRYWFDAKLDKLTTKTTTILFTNPNTNEDILFNEPLITIINNNKTNMIGNAGCIVSGSITNNDKSKLIDIAGANLNMGIKFTYVYIKDTTDIKGPTLGPLKSSNTEKAEITERFVATTAMAAYAMSRLGIS